MDYIELVGPPAVGKTTLLDLLVSERKADVGWKKYEEAIFDIVASLQWHELTTTKSAVLYLADRINFIRYKKLGICNTLIHELTTDISNDIQRKYEYLLDSQIKALASLDENISAINKYGLLGWHKKALQKLFVLETLQYQKTVIFDEGPLKTHFGLHEIELNQIKKSTLPKAVIYCSSSVEENLQKVKKRIALTGQINSIHNGLNDKGMEYLVNYTHRIAEKNIDFIENIGVPVLKIDLTHPVENTDLKSIEAFLKHHSKTTLPPINSPLLKSKKTRFYLSDL